MNTEEMAKVLVTRSIAEVRKKWYEFSEALDIFKPITYEEYHKLTGEFLTSEEYHKLMGGSPGSNDGSGSARNVMSTDGKYLIYDPFGVVEVYAHNKKEGIEHRIIHMLMHGLLGHFYDDDEYTRKKLAWTVMDVQVAQLMNTIGCDTYDPCWWSRSMRSTDPIEQANKLMNTIGCDTYDPCWWSRSMRSTDPIEQANISTIDMSLYYSALRDRKLAAKALEIGRALRSMWDDHDYWWPKRKLRKKQSDSRKDGGNGSSRNNNGKGKYGKNSHEGKNGNSGRKGIGTKDEWDRARANLIAIDGDISSERGLYTALMDAFGRLAQDGELKIHGSGGGSSAQKAEATGPDMDFDRILSEFLTVHSVSREKEDQFDIMLYEYGLDMYGDVPLIEPPDEIEEKSMHNLVIALDTSGSCSEYAGYFIKQVIGLFDKIGDIRFDGVHLLQCDAEIQNVQSFTSVDELRSFKKAQHMFGYGGTDFRPVFDWIDRELGKRGKTTDCLLYFTDGFGDYPEEKPDYPVFMIIPHDKRFNYDNAIDELENFGYFMPDWIKPVMLEIDTKR